MPYPREVVARLTEHYSLSDDAVQTLLATLQTEHMQEMIEEGWLNPIHLVKQQTGVERTTILPLIKAQILAKTFELAKMEALFQSNKLLFSQMIVWLEYNGEAYPYIISPNLAQEVATDPQLIPKLNLLASEFPKEIKQWDDIKTRIQEIHNLPHSKFTQRKIRSLEIGHEIGGILNFLSNPFMHKEYFFVTSVIFQYINAQVKPLEEAARKYFQQLFEHQEKRILNITFSSKTGGNQVGEKMHIAFQTADSERKQQITYYIKTHQYGSTSQHSSSKPVDLKELFIYKVFEYIGVGQKIHFFFNPLSLGGFYIASQDAEYTKNPDKAKLFHTYEQTRDTIQTNATEVTIQGLASLDMLARIFRLRDVTTNPANFGRVLVNTTKQKWKILDFIIDTFASYGYDNIFEGFRQGNGAYNYEGYLRHIVKDRDAIERMQTAMQVIDMLEGGVLRVGQGGKRKLPFFEAIDKAFDEIVVFSQQNEKEIGINLALALGDLEQYRTNVKENFADLARGVRDCHMQLTTISTCKK